MGFRNLDLLYLIRSGLGIPDYWHPRLELREQVFTNGVRLYPLVLDAKANYPGPFNAEGVPVVYLDTVSAPAPVTVILYGLASHDVFLQRGEERYRRQIMHAVNWLKKHAVPLGNGISWPYPEDLPVYGLKSPWFSAVVQGFALSLLVRAAQLDKDGGWDALARTAWLGYKLPADAGGFRRQVAAGVVYEEYPAASLNFVFNGMCHALIGLWESWKSGIVPEAEEDFRDGAAALRALLPRFSRGSWSLYSLSDCLGKPLLASPYYQRANGLLAITIGRMVEDEAIRSCGERWTAAADSFLQRTLMSLRISIDRFFHAPALLNSDRSKRLARAGAL